MLEQFRGLRDKQELHLLPLTRRAVWGLDPREKSGEGNLPLGHLGLSLFHQMSRQQYYWP